MTAAVSPTSTFSLRTYLHVLRRQRRVIVLVTVLTALLTALPALLAKPVYSSTASVQISSLEDEGVFSDDGASQQLASDRAQELANEIEILQSSPIRAAVIAQLPSGTPDFRDPKVTQVGFSEIVEITVRADEASTAADVANIYADVYIADRQARSVETINAKVSELRDQSADASSELASINQQLANPALPADQMSNLQLRQTTLIAQVQEYNRRADELAVEAALRGRGTQLISPAALELDPITPSALKAGILGLTLGLLLGLAIAVVADTVQDRVSSREDLASVRPEAAVLAAVPHADFKSSNTPPVFAVREAFRYLRTGVRVFGLNATLRSVLVTSAVGAEGKTTTAANLAIAMADAGDRVVLVDCDLRRPAIHERFSVPNDLGLSSVVVGDATLAEATHFVQANLAVVPAGPPPQNPTELLGSDEFARVLRAIVDQADFTILDSPPVLPVADALIAGQSVDGVLAVCRVNGVRRRAVRELLTRLEEAGIPLVGLVANDVTDENVHDSYGPDRPPERTAAPAADLVT